MTFGELKKMDYPDALPIEMVLVDCLYKHKIDINTVLASYTAAIEKERHENKMRFEEACISILQNMNGNFKGKDKEHVEKRAIHIFNKTKNFVPHALDEQYGYTEDDEKEWEDFCLRVYGTKL